MACSVLKGVGEVVPRRQVWPLAETDVLRRPRPRCRPAAALAHHGFPGCGPGPVRVDRQPAAARRAVSDSDLCALVSGDPVRVQASRISLRSGLVVADYGCHRSAPFPLIPQRHEAALGDDAVARVAVTADSQCHERTGIAVGPREHNIAAGSVCFTQQYGMRCAAAVAMIRSYEAPGERPRPVAGDHSDLPALSA